MAANKSLYNEWWQAQEAFNADLHDAHQGEQHTALHLEYELCLRHADFAESTHSHEYGNPAIHTFIIHLSHC